MGGKKPQTTKEIGDDLEIRFSEFMKSDLGYTEAYRGSNVPSKINYRGTQLDILGVKESTIGKWIVRIVLAITILTIIIGSTIAWLAIPQGYYWGYSILLFSAGFVVSLCAYAASKSAKYYTEYAWVECKCWHTKLVPATEIELMVFKFNNHKKSKHKRHYFRHKYFVAEHGFVPSAIDHARNNKIICYICVDGKFVIVEPK